MLKLELLDFKYSNIDLLVVPVCQNAEIHSDNLILNFIEEVKNLACFTAKDGEMATLFYPCNTSIRRVMFFGLGNMREINSEGLRTFAGKSVSYCLDNKVKRLTYAMPSLDNFDIKQHDIFYSVMEGSLLRNYNFDLYKKKNEKILLEEIFLSVSNKKQLCFSSLIFEVETVCSATLLARKWVDTPSNDKIPNRFAKLIKDSSNNTDLGISVLDKNWLHNNKLEAMLAVGQGSDNDPCLVLMEHNPSNFDRTILLVGKGVTFDSGGINLKPTTGLEGMKTDMAGAAAVAGVMIAISKLEIQDRIIGIIPLVENMLSGNATRPGDIVKTFLGKTVEVSNTDAEGRLILIDSMAWGIEEYKPDIVIDIATLTGACAVALGDKIAGVFSNDTQLSSAIVEAGHKTFERCWSMPLPNDYLELLKSELSDLNNASSSKWGGAITAALFLSEFIGEVPWAHIDIAGPARSSKKTGYCGVGATGFGVRLIHEFIKALQKGGKEKIFGN